MPSYLNFARYLRHCTCFHIITFTHKMCNKLFKPLMFTPMDEYGLVRICRTYTHKTFKMKKNVKNFLYFSNILKYTWRKTIHIQQKILPFQYKHKIIHKHNVHILKLLASKDDIHTSIIHPMVHQTMNPSQCSVEKNLSFKL